MKKSLRKIAIGFPIGVTILCLVYGALYLINGSNEYQNELILVMDGVVYLQQLFYSGVVVVYTMYLYELFSLILSENEDKKNKKILIIMIFSLILFIVLSFITCKNNLFIKSELVEDCFFGSILILFILKIIINMIYFEIQVKSINKILKK